MFTEENCMKCRIEGVNLIDLDFFSKSDPVCIVEELVDGGWITRDQTERISNNLNPVFTKEVEFAVSSRSQTMSFTMWDHDGGSSFELIGLKKCTVEELLNR